MDKSARLREFQRSCERVDRQVEEIQENLTSNLKRVAEKNKRLQELNLNRGHSFQDIVDREDQLNEYAESIMHRIELLKVGKERIRKHVESMRFHLDTEITENKRQLELLAKRMKMLAETRRILSEENVKLYQAILEKSSRINTLAEHQDNTMTEIYNMSLRESSLMLGTDANSLASLRHDVEQVDEAIAATRDSIQKLDTERSSLLLTHRGIDSELIRVQRRLKSAELEYTESIGELSGEIQEQADKHQSILRKQKNRSKMSESIHDGNNTSIVGIKNSESQILCLAKRIKSTKRKVAKARDAVAQIREEKKEIERKTQMLRSERKKLEGEHSDNKARIEKASEERAQIKSVCGNLKMEIEKANRQCDADRQSVEEQEKLASVACKVYEMIDFAKQRQDALKQGLARVKSQKLEQVDVANEPEVVEMQRRCKRRAKKCEENVREVKEDAEVIQQQLVKLEVEMKTPKSEVAKLRDGVERVFKSFRELCQTDGAPTLASVTEFLEEEPRRRRKALKRKQRKASALENKVDERMNRIEERNERLARKKESLGHSENALTHITEAYARYDALKRFLLALRSEKSTWVSVVEEEVPILLRRWEAEVKSLSST